MSSSLRGSSLINNCTPSISYDRQVQSGCTAFDYQMWEIIDDTPQVIMIPNILALTDEKLVDILAWQFHVDFYDPTRDLEFKKNLVQKSITWHMRKGTVDLVQEVLDTYWKDGATVTEWYEYMDPLPPNYPTVSADTLVKTFTSANVDITNNQFINLSGHGLVNNDQIVFFQERLVPSATLPQPLLPGLYYRAVNVTASTFKVAPSLNASPIDLLTVGSGTSSIYKRGLGDWHDRYRFRILIDQNVIQPEDEAAVLDLIDRYKPVSRWLEGLFRMQTSECDIGWAGMTLQFIIKESKAPPYP